MHLTLIRDTRLNNCIHNYIHMHVIYECNIINIHNNISEFKSFDDSHSHKYSAAQLQLPSSDSSSSTISSL